ncbi:hypothetical protein G9C85_16315 [Halorubellus sp. JP-L1]|uniref:DegT/DnrJ/EryC1/StrS family aminotransferase n=1 Tax=Halorubellus sp. JP-L1 TaxID=2715753 RepID=UPI00140C4E08|nr:DegT/DnrJ/EryC1/StrS family aminotransferase [Halorubellus sp. JP-L1]NHN43183.1 hypothetical protein [Halorubellus sp. JP-L1]
MAMDEDATRTTTTGRSHPARDPPDSPAVRELATALTPVTAGDLLAGIVGQAGGRGRDAFVDAVKSHLGASSAATYCSYRRALGAAFSRLREHGGADRSVLLLPAFCSSDFADAADGVGLDVRRYDVDPRTLAADLESLRAALGEDVLAVVAVNVLGFGSDMTALESICTESDAALVEALGYALGASYDGRPLGTFGDLSVVNFQQGKPIPVGGGMVLSQRSDCSFSDAGREQSAPNVAALTGYALCSRPRPYYAYSRIAPALARVLGGTDELTTHPGSKFDVAYGEHSPTMSDFQGAIAGRVFDRLPETRRDRAATARAYADAFEGYEHVRGIQPIDGLEGHQWVRYPLVVSSNELRAEIKRTLAKHGVQAPLLYNWPKVRGREFPGARALQRRILPLPTHPFVDDDDVHRIVAIVHHVAHEYENRI